MRNIEGLALCGLCLVSPLYAATPTEPPLPPALEHCQDIPAADWNPITQACSNSRPAEGSTTTDTPVSQPGGSNVEKGVPDSGASDTEGELPGSTAGEEAGAEPITGSRRIMWRQIM
ncbi:hypothetical protein D3C76_480450 [compost metagenome]